MSIIKPVADWFIAFGCFIILLPFLFLLTIVLGITNRGKMFFVQRRIGLHGRPFYLLKFKTMPDTVDHAGHLLPDKERQSAFGNFLRHYHIDELPQFINILKNDLSLIGPRPLLPEYLPFYNEKEQTRHHCRPGITGLVQIMGGNTLNWRQKMRLDIFYAKHLSFGLDMIILRKTVIYFFRKETSIPQNSIFGGESFIDYKNREK